MKYVNIENNNQIVIFALINKLSLRVLEAEDTNYFSWGPHFALIVIGFEIKNILTCLEADYKIFRFFYISECRVLSPTPLPHHDEI